MTFLRATIVAAVLAIAPPSLLAEPFFTEGQPPLSEEAIEEAKLFPRFSALVSAISPAVVNISVEGSVAEIEAETQENGDSPLPFPFRPKKGPDTAPRSLGSGFIVSGDGHIVTNNHVISGASKVIVRLLDDKTEYEAKILGVDAKTDLALIKIEHSSKLPTVFLGNSDDIEVGEWVFAIGNQFQLGQTVTAGIVSAKSRRIPANVSGPYDSFIQTDASINPGSSGGPLLNTRGQVIGINTAIFSPGRSALGSSGFNIGIGFAIPINQVKTIISQLEQAGKVTRGLLGVKIQLVTPEVAKLLSLTEPHGALVADIIPDTPASRSGFERKDVITKFNGETVREYEDLPLMVANTAIGASVDVEVVRQGKPKTLHVTIEELTEQAPATVVERVKADELGLVIEDLSQDKARSMNMQKPVGVFVSRVEEGSPADIAGIDQGDVIEELAGIAMTNIESYKKALDEMGEGEVVLAIVRKAEGSRILTIETK